MFFFLYHNRRGLGHVSHLCLAPERLVVEVLRKKQRRRHVVVVVVVVDVRVAIKVKIG